MRTLFATALVVAVTAACGLARAVDIVTSFTSSLGGWTGDSVFHQANGGNPTGHARFADPNTPNEPYLVAPVSYLGSWLSYKDVGALSYDHRIIAISGTYTGVADYRVNIYGPQDQATWFYPAATGLTPWLRRVAPIKESEWFVVGDWNRLLSNVTRLEIQIEHVDGNTGIDVEGIDNVKLFTLPPASADFDNDDDVDGADFLIWQRNHGSGTFFHQGDANNSGTVDDADLEIWEAQYNTTPPQPIVALPEPTLSVMLLGIAWFAYRRH